MLESGTILSDQVRERRRRRLRTSRLIPLVLGVIFTAASVALSSFVPYKVPTVMLEYEEILPNYEPALPAGMEYLPEIVYREISMGRASYYGSAFAGRRTASGEIFNPDSMTAAHPSLPFGSIVRVTNIRNNRSVIVRINDRGPFVGKRIIDLSRAAASELGFVRRGTTTVRIELLVQ